MPSSAAQPPDRPAARTRSAYSMSASVAEGGADVYCGTLLILSENESRAPQARSF
jgi:hypothetical protein